MSKCKRSVLVATLIYICAASPAGAAPEVCVRLLEHGVYDEAQKYTYDDQLRAVRSALCKSFSSTYEEARDSSARAGIDIIGELSGYAGGEVRSNNFDEVRRNYCRDISSLSTSIKLNLKVLFILSKI